MTFLEGRLLSSQSEQSERSSKSSDWLEKSRPSKKPLLFWSCKQAKMTHFKNQKEPRTPLLNSLPICRIHIILMDSVISPYWTTISFFFSTRSFLHLFLLVCHNIIVFVLLQYAFHTHFTLQSQLDTQQLAEKLKCLLPKR